MPTMSTFATLWQILKAVYRLAIVLWNTPFVFVSVIRSVIKVARQEAGEVMASLDNSASALDVVRSTSLGQDTSHPENPWRMLIIARASSFVLLLRLSEQRVLHLDVDERFIMSKLKVIRTELMLHIEHVPRLLRLPIGTHDTRLVRYTPMRLPYLWKETTQVAAERSIVAFAPVSCASDGEVCTQRKKYVQLLAESALRRRMRIDRLRLEAAPKKVLDKVSKKKALVNATNTAATNLDEPTEETCGVEPGVAPKVRVERGLHRIRGENSENHAEQLRRVVSHSLRRKRGQFDLYAQGVSQEFSLLPKN